MCRSNVRIVSLREYFHANSLGLTQNGNFVLNIPLTEELPKLSVIRS